MHSIMHANKTMFAKVSLYIFASASFATTNSVCIGKKKMYYQKMYLVNKIHEI